MNGLHHVKPGLTKLEKDYASMETNRGLMLLEGEKAPGALRRGLRLQWEAPLR